MPVTGRVGRRGSLGLAAAAALVLAACGGGPDPAATTPAPSDTPASEAPAASEPPTPVPGPGPEAGAEPEAPEPEPEAEAEAPEPEHGAEREAPEPEPEAEADTEAPEPVRVVIPAIGVDAPIVPLGLDAAGALEAPAGTVEAGWWTGGPEPGEAGPAVVAGHVDSRWGPAVFFRLRDLRPGDTVTVVRADGSEVAFAVDRQERHPKDSFPTGAVYGDTPGSTLRLVTCGGAFDRSSGHYVDNVIVFAGRR